MTLPGPDYIFSGTALNEGFDVINLINGQNEDAQYIVGSENVQVNSSLGTHTISLVGSVPAGTYGNADNFVTFVLNDFGQITAIQTYPDQKGITGTGTGIISLNSQIGSDQTFIGSGIDISSSGNNHFFTNLVEGTDGITVSTSITGTPIISGSDILAVVDTKVADIIGSGGVSVTSTTGTNGLVYTIGATELISPTGTRGMNLNINPLTGGTLFEFGSDTYNNIAVGNSPTGGSSINTAIPNAIGGTSSLSQYNIGIGAGAGLRLFQGTNNILIGQEAGAGGGNAYDIIAIGNEVGNDRWEESNPSVGRDAVVLGHKVFSRITGALNNVIAAGNTVGSSITGSAIDVIALGHNITITGTNPTNRILVGSGITSTTDGEIQLGGTNSTSLKISGTSAYTGSSVLQPVYKNGICVGGGTTLPLPKNYYDVYVEQATGTTVSILDDSLCRDITNTDDIDFTSLTTVNINN